MESVETEFDIASRQLGLISLVQARSCGLSDPAIRHRVESGRWRRIRRGVFVVSGAPVSRDQAIFAVVLSAGRQAWASHATSAQLCDLLAPSEPIEITVPLEARPRIPGVRVHRSGTLTEPDIRSVDGIPTLSPARTIADLSSRLSLDQLARMVDDGLRRGILTVRALDRVVQHLSGIAPGRSPAKLRKLLIDRVPGYHGTHSDLEQWVYSIIVGAGLPEPVRQHKVVVGTNTYYLDLAYPTRMLDIETDGFDVHRGRAVFDTDRVRQNDLVSVGWTILRFTTNSTPDEIVRATTQALFGRLPSL